MSSCQNEPLPVEMWIGWNTRSLFFIICIVGVASRARGRRKMGQTKGWHSSDFARQEDGSDTAGSNLGDPRMARMKADESFSLSKMSFVVDVMVSQIGVDGEDAMRPGRISRDFRIHRVRTFYGFDREGTSGSRMRLEGCDCGPGGPPGGYPTPTPPRISYPCVTYRPSTSRGSYRGLSTRPYYTTRLPTTPLPDATTSSDSNDAPKLPTESNPEEAVAVEESPTGQPPDQDAQNPPVGPPPDQEAQNAPDPTPS